MLRHAMVGAVLVLVMQDCQHSRIPNLRLLVLAAPCIIFALEAMPTVGGMP